MYRQKNGTDPVERLDVVLRDKTRYKKVRGAKPASIVRHSSQERKRLKELRENAPARDKRSEEQRSEELKTRSGSRYEEKRSQEAAVRTGSRYESEKKQEKAARALPAPVARTLAALSGLKRRNAAMIAAITIAAALVIGYAVVGVFYTSHFYDGTTIFGIDCSRYTAARAKEEVAEKVSMYSLTVESRTGTDVISAGEIGLRYRDSGTIERLLRTQKSFLWPLMMSMRRNTVITIDTDYDVPKMDRELEAFSCYRRVNEIMPQDAHLVRPHTRHGTRRIHPVGQFVPHLLVGQVARNDVETDARTLQHAGQFGHRAGLAVSQPLARHQCPVAQSVQVVVVDGRNGLYVQQQNGLAHPLHQGKNGG